MDYQLGQYYRLEQMDKLNLRLYRWGEIVERDGRGGKIIDTHEGWVFTGKYASNVVEGVRLAFNDATVNFPGECANIDEFRTFINTIRDDLKNVVIGNVTN